MARIDKLVRSMRNNPRDVRYAELVAVCDHYFGAARHTGGSHSVYRVPWEKGPRVNIQDDHGLAKPYQVRQVLAAIELIERGPR